MLVKRLIVAIILLPIGVFAIVIGGWAYFIIVAFFLLLASWEYGQLFKLLGYNPASVILVSGVFLLLVGRALHGFASSSWLLSLLILVSLVYHLVAYERGHEQAGTDFSITIGGIIYIGWIGAYLISLRDLPNGQWWVLIVLPAVWLADSCAYFIGKQFGRHPLSPRLSPKKTWEGYLGGILIGTPLTVLLAWIWQTTAGPTIGITPLRGLVIGLVMSIFPTLGDLGESMFKRQAGVKDSSHLLPGHGGAFDRIDSWLWAGILGYYLVTWLWV